MLSLPDAPAIVLPSEGGHAAFPFCAGEEQDFAVFLAAGRNLPYARGDDVVSGSGLVALHAFLEGHLLSAAELTGGSGFAASRTCRLFARFYARVCRGLALACLPAVLLVTGGLAAKSPCLVLCEEFRREFLHIPGAHRDTLARIPVFLNTNQDAGLWGAAYAGLTRGPR
jgi:glucokinase